MAEQLTPLSKVKLSPSDKVEMLNQLRAQMSAEQMTVNTVPSIKKKSRWVRGVFISGGTIAAAVAIVAGLAINNMRSPKESNQPQGVPGIISTAYAYTLVAPSHFNAIDMTSATDGWGTGYDNAGHFQLIKTTDGGEGWNKVQLPVSPPTYDVSTNQIGQPGYVRGDFLNGSTGWLCWINDNKQEMTVEKTTDGGQHWMISQTKMPLYAQTVSNVDFVNASTGWILATSTVGSESEQKYIFRTTNGGQSWSSVASSIPPSGQLPYQGTFTNLSFSSATQGWFGTGDMTSASLDLFHSLNGGKTWTKVNLPVPKMFQQQSNAIDVSTPVFQGQQGTFVGTYVKLENGADHNYIVVYHTKDGGKTWIPSKPQEEPSALYMGVHDGWMVNHKSVYQTQNTGQTWGRISTLASINWTKYPVVSDITFVNQKTGWLLVQSTDFQKSVLLKTIDGGYTWHEQ